MSGVLDRVPVLTQTPRGLVSVAAVDTELSSEQDVIRVLIAYGDNFARTGLRAVLGTRRDMAVVGCAADGDEALALARQFQPDVMLVDIALPRIDGVELTRRLALDRELSDVCVVILSVSEEHDALCASLRAGAKGFLLHDVESAEVIRAVRTVAAGEAALSPSLVRLVIGEFASRPDPQLPGPSQLDELTRREREIMTLVAEGLSNAEIAERLVVSPATARTHVSRALGKLRLRDRAQLVTLAYETGLVLPRQTGAARSRMRPATLARGGSARRSSWGSSGDLLPVNRASP
jgi:DNA-binding NarL/FixJ family response regulator